MTIIIMITRIIKTNKKEGLSEVELSRRNGNNPESSSTIKMTRISMNMINNIIIKTRVIVNMVRT
jgi:hypothetical protein